MRKTIRIRFILLDSSQKLDEYLHYHELMGKTEGHEKNIYLMVDNYMVNKVLDKIKEIMRIRKIYNFKILIDTDDKFPDNITLLMILMTRDINDINDTYDINETCYKRLREISSTT